MAYSRNGSEDTLQGTPARKSCLANAVVIARVDVHMGYGGNKILAYRGQAQQDTGLRELRGEVKRLKSGHPASSSEKEGERPKAVSQKEDVHKEQEEEKVSRNPVGCTEEVL